MLGPILLAVGIVLVLPPLLLVTGMLFAAVLGWAATDNAERTHEGSELIDLNT